MASGDVARLFELREDVTEKSISAVRTAAVRDADRLRAVLYSHRFRVKESTERVYANGLLSRGYAPRRIEATGPESDFQAYSREITGALGTWYTTVSENNVARTARKQPA